MFKDQQKNNKQIPPITTLNQINPDLRKISEVKSFRIRRSISIQQYDY